MILGFYGDMEQKYDTIKLFSGVTLLRDKNMIHEKSCGAIVYTIDNGEIQKLETKGI